MTTLSIGSSRNPEGFTLIEVLLSLMVISVGAVFILQALAKIAETFTIAENRIVAYRFTASKLEEIESTPSDKETFLLPQEGAFKEGNTRFNWSWTPRLVLEEDPTLAEASFTVRWKRGVWEYSHQADTLLRLSIKKEENAVKVP